MDDLLMDLPISGEQFEQFVFIDTNCETHGGMGDAEICDKIKGSTALSSDLGCCKEPVVYFSDVCESLVMFDHSWTIC